MKPNEAPLKQSVGVMATAITAALALLTPDVVCAGTARVEQKPPRVTVLENKVTGLVEENARLKHDIEEAQKTQPSETAKILADLQEHRKIVAIIGTEAAARRALAEFFKEAYAKTDAAITEDHESVIVQLPQMVFEYGSRKMPANVRKLLSPIVQASIRFGNNFDLYVEGHADSVPVRPNGLYRNNYDVGYWRSSSVTAQLQKMCAPEDNLVLSTRGANLPLADGKANNRRVDFVFAPRRGAETIMSENGQTAPDSIVPIAENSQLPPAPKSSEMKAPALAPPATRPTPETKPSVPPVTSASLVAPVPSPAPISFTANIPPPVPPLPVPRPTTEADSRALVDPAGKSLPVLPPPPTINGNDAPPPPATPVPRLKTLN